MEEILQAPKTFSSDVKTKAVLPLNQLLEESKKTSSISHHLLETRFYTKVKSKNVEAEPSELHFSGFEVGKSYKRFLKLINISSEVLDVHIIFTQTKYFRTESIKKNRLVPGISYSIVVHFSSTEWRYFSDDIRIHCKGEENLLIPVHAYPIIDDLHLPAHISLPTVPLGHRTSSVIPLKCSCPVDFEFQVHCLQPNEAFTVEPLSGIIPANDRTEFTVTFTPYQYGTAEIILQLVISQFNSKPFISTITGFCSPYSSLRQHEKNEECDRIFTELPKKEGTTLLPAASKPKPKMGLSKEKHNGKIELGQSGRLDVSTLAGLTRMLIQNQDKMAIKQLQDTMLYTKTTYQTRQIKEAAFENQVCVNAQKERENNLRWQVNLGEDLSSNKQKMTILKEQEFAVGKYKTTKYLCDREVNLTRGLSTHRILRNSAQLPSCMPVFYGCGSRQLEIRQRALRLFQQTVRKVILQCQTDNRLHFLRGLVSSMKSSRGVKGTDTVHVKTVCKLSSKMQLRFNFCTPSSHHDKPDMEGLGHVNVRPLNAYITLNIPFFNLKIPQHYNLMRYQKVPVYETGASFVPPDICWPLRTGAEDELLISLKGSVFRSNLEMKLQQSKQDITNTLSLSPPRNLLNPHSHPLRIFNSASCVYALPTQLYLKADVDFNHCPLPRHLICKGNTMGLSASRKGILTADMLLKMFPSITSSVSIIGSKWTSQLSDHFDSSVLPMEAPPVLQDFDDSNREEIIAAQVEDAVVNLTPEMVQAEFAPVTENYTNDRKTYESSLNTPTSQLSLKVLARMEILRSMSYKAFKEC